MNKTATSRQALLEAAREIARRDGLGHISIRRTAAMCGVSIGTVYNYYPAKADLVLAVIEDFWKRVFHGGLSCDFTHGSDFSAVCGQIYTALRTHLAQCCFSKRMRKLFRKNEKSVLRFCNKSSKTKRAFTKVLMPCKRPF